MGKPVAVLISDIHYNMKNLTLADAALRMSVAKAKELSVPLIVAGDLHDSKAQIRAECMNAMIATLSLEPSVYKIIIPGNHCMINEKSSDHSLGFLNKICNIIDKPGFVPKNLIWDVGPLGFYYIPYQSDASVIVDALKGLPEGLTIIMHQGVLGADIGAYIQDKTSLPKETFKDFRVISGHYHKHQDIKCGRPRKGAVGLFSYLGSPYTQSFAEANDGPKGFHVLGDDGILTMVPTNLRKHVIVECTVDTLLNTAVDANPGDLVWFKVTGLRSQLQTITKTCIREHVLNIADFKLDLIPTDGAKPQSIKIEAKSDLELMDELIMNLEDTEEHKAYLKSLYLEALNEAT